MTSIWNDPIANQHHMMDSPHKELHENVEDSNEDQSECNSQELEPEDNEEATNFVKPKANEKKDKKSKKAEEKRKAKEAKKAAEAAGPYIPGMTGTVRPEEQIVVTGNIMDLKEEEKMREQQEAVRRQREQMEALNKLQEDQKMKLEREEQMRIQQEKLNKLAPWAKKDSSPVEEHGQGMTLKEIQKLEAERGRKERKAREVHEARLREEQARLEEEERVRRASKTVNWATAAAPAGGKVKSLAEIQEEEERLAREREKVARSARRQETGGSGGSSVWGGGAGKTTWAGKIAANTPVTPSQTRAAGNPWSGQNGVSAAAVVAPEGFWDPVLPQQQQQQQQQQQIKKQASGSNINNPSAKAGKKKKDDEQVRGKQKSRNEFEDWCSRALNELQAQVDIPTFLGFLMDIESPYDVSH